MLLRIALPMLIMFLPRLLPGIWRFLRLVWRLSFDKRVPLILRLLVPVALLYALSPLDLLKDTIPILGRFDDVIFLMLALLFLVKFSPPEVVAEHWGGRRPPPPPPQEQDPSKVVDGTAQVVE